MSQSISTYSARRPATSQFVEARGFRHHVWTWGDPSQITAERPPFVLVHGYMDVGASFQFLVDAMERLEGPTRYVIALDLRGFGLSETVPTDCYWFPDYMGDLEAVLDVLVPGRTIDLLGHSMGGNVVMLYAGVRPERVRRLLNLEGFGMPEVAPVEAPVRYATWLDQLKTPQTLPSFADYAGVAQRLLRNNPRLPADKAAWLATRWASDHSGTIQVLGDPAHKRINPMLYRVEEVRACFRRITARVLFVEGQQTEAERFWGGRYKLADAHARLSVIADLEHAVIADAGHMLHHDQPEALADRVVPFLG